MVCSPILLALSISAAAVAATPTIEEITIIASRTPTPLDRAPAPVEIVERAAIDARQSGQVADLLRGAPGFAVSQSGGSGSVTEIRLRGAEANHLLVSIDGIEINDPALGSNVDFANLDLIGATRIEILPGAQTALWGSDALAGVINIETAPSAGVVRRNLVFEGGSDDTRREAVELADGRGAWRYAASARHTETAGTNIATIGGEDDGYHNSTVHLNTLYSGERGSFRVVARNVHAQSEYDPTPFPAYVPVDGDLELDVRQRLGGISANYLVRPDWDQRVVVTHYDARNANFEQGIRSGSSDGDKTHVGYQSDFFFTTAGQRLTLAYEYEVEGFTQRGAPGPFGNPNQNQRYDSNSLIAEYAADWRWASATVSARRDDNSDFDDSNGYRAALRVPVAAHGTTLFVSVGTGTKNPTFVERFGFTPDTFIGNPNLRPEQSRSSSVAVEQRVADVARLRLGVFRDELRDEIDGFVFDAALAGFTARNGPGHSRREGIEFALQATPNPNTDLQLDFTYLRATEPGAGEDDDELRRPTYTGRFIVGYGAFADRLQLQAGVAYVGTHDDADFGVFPARRVKLDAYTLLHCTARYELSNRFVVTGRVENLSDEHYQDVFGYATPGRRAYLGLTMTL
jgi:vitamin B12 transporter